MNVATVFPVHETRTEHDSISDIDDRHSQQRREFIFISSNLSKVLKEEKYSILLGYVCSINIEKQISINNSASFRFIRSNKSDFHTYLYFKCEYQFEILHLSISIIHKTYKNKS